MNNNTTMKLGKLQNLNTSIKMIPDEAEDKSARRKALNARKRKLILAQSKKFIMRSTDNVGGTQASQSLGKDQKKNVQSIYMKSNMIQRMMDHENQRQQFKYYANPADTLDKNAVSYKQIKKEPVSYNTIQSRLQKWKETREIDGDDDNHLFSNNNYDIEGFNKDESREKSLDSASRVGKNYQSQEMYKELKGLQPLTKNIFQAKLTRNLAGNFEEQKSFKNSSEFRGQVEKDYYQTTKHKPSLFKLKQNSSIDERKKSKFYDDFVVTSQSKPAIKSKLKKKSLRHQLELVL
ncbi:UNKNOWN [Stylonychia lemnae]|uniref:Uncharacterized protein n=1 Tax=Stylonychia lemnae TaxID=5949 RepID=A0A078ASK3_STYLE|nr:UNKNOWN [Stylonychia lemnae]|eukprot:CDW85445.1 UNKNOWN [Stylonychia lemnae]